MRRWIWFIGLYIVSIVVLGSIAMAIRMTLL